MLSDNIAISIHNLSKCFYVYDHPRDYLRQMMKKFLYELLKRPFTNYYREFWALRDVNLDIKKGETVGIVGRNGAGKSTLLQLICGTLNPTSGDIRVNGRIAALLELGAGFNPEFTGRENVFLYGSVLGLTEAEIKNKFSRIIEFADIGDCLDQPVKTYSSGMFVRLAFAVSICVDPEILIVDEALSVGDVKFQAKCFRHFEKLIAAGKTIIFVTHSTEQIVRHCNWAILLDSGKIIKQDKPKVIENLYLDLLFGTPEKDEESEKPEEKSKKPFRTPLKPLEESGHYNAEEYRWGTREAEIIGFAMAGEDPPNSGSFSSGNTIHTEISVLFHKPVQLPIFGITIKTPDGIIIYGTNTRDTKNGPFFRPCKKGDVVNIQFSVEQRLVQGDYMLSFGVVELTNGELIPLDRRYDAIHIHVRSDQSCFGLTDMDTDVKIL
jgi:lipopolysaccharide transport system ATP-binding protein